MRAYTANTSTGRFNAGYVIKGNVFGRNMRNAAANAQRKSARQEARKVIKESIVDVA